MCSLHNAFQFGHFFRELVQYIVAFRRIGIQVIEFEIRIFAANVHVN